MYIRKHQEHKQNKMNEFQANRNMYEEQYQTNYSENANEPPYYYQE